MPRSPYTDDQLILAARLYYLDGLPQAQVARLVNVSQAKVSRMLALAKDRGLVRISVADYQPRDLALEGELEQELGIDALVIRSVPGLPDSDLRQMIGYLAAPTVLEWLEDASLVAVGGGRTIQALVEHMKPAAHSRPVELVQAMGTIDPSPGPYDAEELCRSLTRYLKGTFLRLNAPVFVHDAEVRAQLLRLDQIQQAMGRLSSADLVLVGVGALENSVFMERKALAPDDFAALRAAGAVGEVLGHFYDQSGRECETPLRDRVISLDLDRLRKIKKRVGIAAGTERTAALLAAVRGGLLDTVVIGDSGARALLKAAR